MGWRLLANPKYLKFLLLSRPKTCPVISIRLPFQGLPCGPVLQTVASQQMHQWQGPSPRARAKDVHASCPGWLRSRSYRAVKASTSLSNHYPDWLVMPTSSGLWPAFSYRIGNQMHKWKIWERVTCFLQKWGLWDLISKWFQRGGDRDIRGRVCRSVSDDPASPTGDALRTLPLPRPRVVVPPQLPETDVASLKAHWSRTEIPLQHSVYECWQEECLLNFVFCISFLK